jgi:hypothetical protein
MLGHNMFVGLRIPLFHFTKSIPVLVKKTNPIAGRNPMLIFGLKRQCVITHRIEFC